MDDLISEFITETSESLGTLDLELVKLEQNPNDETVLGNIFRLVHTIKGTCGFLGLPRLETVAHASENVLGKIRDKTMVVTPEAISIVLESLDRIKSIMEYLGTKGEEPAGDDTDLIARLNAFAENGKAPAAAQKPVAAPVAAKIEEPVAKVEPVAALPVPQPAVEKEKKSEELSPKAKEQAIAQGLATEGKDSAAGAGQSIRVNLDVLEHLMQMVSELVLTRNQLLQISRTRSDNVFATPLQQLSHITSELQEGVMKTRMQPIGNAWSKFPRLIRDLAMELGKKIELRMIGAETELDRQLLEMIKDPLTHMVRNSADHGLERTEDRVTAGKPETGTVTLRAYHEGGQIIIEISDDGRGIHVEKIKQKIVEKGLANVAELENMPESQIIQYIFRAGFSTAEKVTSVSGRGVGMDVVRTNIEKIGGTIELSSVFGKGSTFHIKIPLTLAIVSVLIVETLNERFAIPQMNVLELVRATGDSEYKIEYIHGAPVLRLREKLLPLISLSQVLQLERKSVQEGGTQENFIVVCKVGSTDFGILVDRIYDTEEIVVKPVAEILRHIPVYSGSTILGDGSVIMILDPMGLAKSTGGNIETTRDDEANAMKHGNLNEQAINFLLFRAGSGSPKAVPLELVSRLEEIDATKIESGGDRKVLQYRGDLMRLVTLNDEYAIPTEGMPQVIVFNYDGRVLGLVVEEIIDIVEASFDIKITGKQQSLFGSMVIANKATDVVDVGFLLKDIVDMSLVDKHKKDQAQSSRLMLVEDSPFFRNLTVPFLVAAGYEVITAEHGEDALKQLAKWKEVDLIVTDIEMPGMDGFTLAEAIRGQREYAHIPILAFTSTVNQELINRSKKVGLRDFVLKTDRARLLQAISGVLKREREAA